MVNVGIFWVIHKKIWYKIEQRSKNECNGTKIDSSLGHYTEWYKGILHLKYREDDFATYPRGRIIYDKEKNEHIIYADKCIKDEEILKIAKLFGAKKYRVEGDLHYACDVCFSLE